MDSGYAAWAARWRVSLGFVVGALYLVLAQPTPRLLVGGAPLALGGLLLRAWAAGHLEKGRALAMAGPYRLTRNPLYFGSLMIGCGLAVQGGSWIAGLIFLVFFVFIYVPVMRREGAALRQQFGEAYTRYEARVPLLVPSPLRPRLEAVGTEKFQWGHYRRNREFQAELGYLAALLFLTAKMWLR